MSEYDDAEGYRGLAATTEEGLGAAQAITLGAALDEPEAEREPVDEGEWSPLYKPVPRALAAHRRAMGAGIRDGEADDHDDEEIPGSVRGYLVPGEEHARAFPLHPCAMGKADLVLVGALVAAVALHILAYMHGWAHPFVVRAIWVSFGIAAGWWGWRLAIIRATWIVITPKRIMTVAYFPTTKVTSLPWRRARDVELNQTILGRAFGYGTLQLLSIGTDHALASVPYVPHVQRVYRIIWAILQPTRGPSPMPREVE